MKLDVNLSPDVVKALLVGGGLLLTYGVWATLSDVTIKMRYQPVYGEQSGSSELSDPSVTYSLPIVQASTEKELSAGESPISDDQIEAAFNLPMPAVDQEEDAKKAVRKLTVKEIFQATYNPTVEAISDGGVFLAGGFWRVGEAVMSMPVRDSVGNVVYPVILGVSSRGVTLRLDAEPISLPFVHY